MKRWLFIACCLGTFAAAGLGQAPTSEKPVAEKPLQKLFGWVGGKSKEPAPAVPTMQENPSRLTEIQIELAWLADPVTFPYYLEAKVEGPALQVRGYVPNRQVRDQALRLARGYSQLAVIDGTKEHPSLLVSAKKVPPQQLYNALVSSLKDALPRHYQQLQGQAFADGKIVLAGKLPAWEQKLAASRALRRLPGCTSIQNTITIPAAPQAVGPQAIVKNAAAPAPSTPNVVLAGSKQPAPTTTTTVPTQIAPAPVLVRQPEPVAKTTIDEGTLTRGVAIEQRVEARPPVNVTPALLKKSIEESCPDISDVRVSFKSQKEVAVEVRTRAGDDPGLVAGRILSLQMLDPFKVDLHIQVPE